MAEITGVNKRLNEEEVPLGVVASHSVHEGDAQISIPLELSMMSAESGEAQFSPRFSDIANSWDNSLLDHVDDTALLFDLDAFACLPSPIGSRSPHHQQTRSTVVELGAALAPRQQVTSTSSGHVAHVAASSSNQTIAPSLMTKKTKSANAETPAVTGKKRVKRKDEITLLRDEAPRLQEQLDDLIAYWKHKSLALLAQSSRSEDRDGDSTTAGCAEPKWRSIAAHRRDELKASEIENERLSAQVQLHRRTLQHIRKLLAKRVVSATVLQQQLDVFFQLSPQHVRVGSTSAFQSLLVDSDAMRTSFQKVQHVLYLRQMQRQQEEEERRDWKLQHDGRHGVFVEMVSRYVVPFDKAKVTKALRSLYTRQDGELRVCEFFNSSEDTILTQFIAGFHNSEGSGTVRTQYVVRQFDNNEGEDSSQQQSSHFLVSGLIDRLETDGASKNLVRLREKTWMLITSCPSSTARQPVTIIQTYYTMAPEVGSSYTYNNSDDVDRLWDRKVVQQMLIPNLDLSMDKLQCGLERELVNLSTKYRRPTSSSS